MVNFCICPRHWQKRLPVSFATTKANYSMKTLFDMDMGRLTDAGIIQKLFREITPPKDFKSAAQSHVLDLWHFMSIFLLCGCLMMASILIFIFELLLKKTNVERPLLKVAPLACSTRLTHSTRPTCSTRPTRSTSTTCFTIPTRAAPF
jgi:hypothetical protein